MVLLYNVILCQTLFSEGVDNLGKDLKGKELGAGIVQKKDKRYVARYIRKVSGKRVEKYF